jgi:hypothetical protein
MRRLLFAATCFVAFAAASAASAQDEAPVDVEAASDDPCQRAGGRRGVMAQSRACRTAYSAVQQCDYAVSVRAAALRYASGKRRHVRIARCV